MSTALSAYVSCAKAAARTKLIQDAATARPMYTNMVNGTVGICRAEGVSGIYRGLWPTVSFCVGQSQKLS